jgi:hypothetical protein
MSALTDTPVRIARNYFRLRAGLTKAFLFSRSPMTYPGRWKHGLEQAGGSVLHLH